MMYKLVQVIGTRPQYIKLTRFPGDFVIDTGQHYSADLCKDAPEVDIRLEWTGVKDAVLKVKVILSDLKPKCVIVYGDTYSTLAGAYAAKALNTPIAHIEAGIRTIQNTVENRIRRKVDSIAAYCFCHNKSVLINLVENSSTDFVVGDLLYDKFLGKQIKLRPNVCLATIHRRENLPDLQKILNRLGEFNGVVHFYVHPHTHEYLLKCDIPNNVHIYDCISYEKIGEELRQARLVITDSGGLVRETFWSGVPLEIIGENPWPEVRAFGDGKAGEKIWNVLKEL